MSQKNKKRPPSQNESVQTPGSRVSSSLGGQPISKRNSIRNSTNNSFENPLKKSSSLRANSHDGRGNANKNPTKKMLKPPLLPPSGRTKIPGTFQSDPDHLKQKMLERAGLKKSLNEQGHQNKARKSFQMPGEGQINVGVKPGMLEDYDPKL